MHNTNKNSYDVIQWQTLNWIRKFRPVTDIYIQLMHQSADGVFCRKIYENFPNDAYGSVSQLSKTNSAYAAAQHVLQHTAAYGGKPMPMNRPNYKGTDLIRTPENIIAIDNQTGYFNTFDYTEYNTDAELVDEFQDIYLHYFKTIGYCGTMTVPYGMGRQLATDIVAQAAKFARNQRWFAENLHKYISENMSQITK